MSRVKGKGTILKANFVGKGKSKKNFPDLSNTDNLMLLSIVGNEYCEGEYVEAALNYSLQHHRFTTLLIADEVYWHNLKPLSTSQEPLSQEKINALKQAAIKLGTDYFERNLKHFLAPLRMSAESFNQAHGDKNTSEKIAVINQLTHRAGLHFKIVGWHDWISTQQDFEQHQAEIMTLYQTKQVLRNSIEKTATDFAKRHEQEGGFALWLHRAVGYLTEESPAVMWIAAALGYNFVTYPGDMLDTFQATKDYFVVPATLDACERPPFAIIVKQPNLLVNWIQTYFKRENPKPKTTATSTNYSAQFFAPKPNVSKAELGPALSDAMLTTMAFSDVEPKKQEFDHVIQDLSSLLFSLNNKQRKELLDLIARISTVVDIVQDYQGQESQQPTVVEVQGDSMRKDKILPLPIDPQPKAAPYDCSEDTQDKEESHNLMRAY